MIEPDTADILAKVVGLVFALAAWVFYLTDAPFRSQSPGAVLFVGLLLAGLVLMLMGYTGLRGLSSIQWGGGK